MQTFAVDPHRLEQMLNSCVDFAKMMLEKHGEFYPFGAALDASGNLTSVGGYTGQERPPGPDVYRLLLESLRAQFSNSQIIAASVAANVNIPKEYQSPYPDGIRVLLECRGFSRFIYLPYRISQSGVTYADMIPVEVPPTICA